MKTKNKIYLQCGYEDECRSKDCINCRKNIDPHIVRLSQAEMIVIEDFAVCDLKAMLEDKPEEVELMQDVMRRIMKKVYK
jgi:hypothetical protein